MTGTMRERIARAILDARFGAIPAIEYGINTDVLIPSALVEADAVLAAMRSPTPKMLNAAAKAMSPAHRPTQDRVGCRAKHRIRYQAMIDAALENCP